VDTLHRKQCIYNMVEQRPHRLSYAVSHPGSIGSTHPPTPRPHQHRQLYTFRPTLPMFSYAQFFLQPPRFSESVSGCLTAIPFSSLRCMGPGDRQRPALCLHMIDLTGSHRPVLQQLLNPARVRLGPRSDLAHPQLGCSMLLRLIELSTMGRGCAA